MDSMGQSFCLKSEILWCSLNLTFGCLCCFHFIIFSLPFHNSTQCARCYSNLFSATKAQLLYSWLLLQLQISLNSDIVYPLPFQLNAPKFSKLGSHALHIHSCRRAASVPIY